MLKISTALALMTPLLATLPARAETTHDPGAGTPKGALHAADRAAASGDEAKVLGFYLAQTDAEKRIAQAMARLDLAGAKVEHFAREKFTNEQAAEILHAMRSATTEDIDAADETIEGDVATIEAKDHHGSWILRKVDGAWKVGIADNLGEVKDDAEARKWARLYDDMTAELKRTAAEIESGKYPNAPLLVRALKQRTERIWGPEHK
jgi:hypothetical protein